MVAIRMVVGVRDAKAAGSRGDIDATLRAADDLRVSGMKRGTIHGSLRVFEH